MLRLAFDFIITWRETRTRPNAYKITTYRLIYFLKFLFYTIYVCITNALVPPKDDRTLFQNAFLFSA